MRMIVRMMVVIVLASAPGLLAARDAALVIVGEEYRNLDAVADAPKTGGLQKDLREAGFAVTFLKDLSPRETRAGIEAFRDDAAVADRVMILVAGHLVHSDRDTWLLARSAEHISNVNIGAAGFPLGPIFDIAAEHPGQAVVMLVHSGVEISGPGLSPGVAVQAPQGVTLLTGSGKRLVNIAREVLLTPGMPPRQALVPAPKGVEVTGFLSDALPFLPAPLRTPDLVRPPGEIDMELAFWNVAVEIGSVGAYQAYLDRYPNGEFRNIALSAIGGAALDAETKAQAEEAALGLDRNARREIQRNLSLLDYNPRGIDGIFGPGSRAAIKSWQAANGFEANGYLTAAQVRRLAETARIRADQLAEEAERRKAEEERRDRDYWRETGRGSTEAGLRTYLERYPDGVFADVANSRLAEIEASQRSEAEAVERTLWDEVRTADSVEAYQHYLERFPDGLFSRAAKARIQELTFAQDDTAARDAQREEREVAGNAVIRLLVENRLAAAGQDPGRVDGQFDNITRRAIRRFQRDQGLPVTGFVTQATMVRLLAVP